MAERIVFNCVREALLPETTGSHTRSLEVQRRSHTVRVRTAGQAGQWHPQIRLTKGMIANVNGIGLTPTAQGTNRMTVGLEIESLIQALS